MPRICINCGWRSRQAQSWRSHTVFQGAPRRRSSQPAVEYILAVPSRGRPLAYVLRIYPQPATPALPGSLPHKEILLRAGLCLPQAHQPLWRHGRSPRTHHWRKLHLRWWCHSPGESWKSKKAMYSNPTKCWLSLPDYFHTRREKTRVTVNLQAELQKCFQLMNPEELIQCCFSKTANCWPPEPCLCVRMPAEL